MNTQIPVTHLAKLPTYNCRRPVCSNIFFCFCFLRMRGIGVVVVRTTKPQSVLVMRVDWRRTRSRCAPPSLSVRMLPSDRKLQTCAKSSAGAVTSWTNTRAITWINKEMKKKCYEMMDGMENATNVLMIAKRQTKVHQIYRMMYGTRTQVFNWSERACHLSYCFF